jgi:hypothetical protein
MVASAWLERPTTKRTMQRPASATRHNQGSPFRGFVDEQIHPARLSKQRGPGAARDPFKVFGLGRVNPLPASPDRQGGI